jgi:hypothetical protein
MSCFKTHIATTTAARPDPTKHVNYQLGMVLGEDDFKQEFAYLSARDQWLARDVVGYGTVRGLSLRCEKDASLGPQVVVHAGAALTPAGQLVCVPTAQRAVFNAWLAANADAVNSLIGSTACPTTLQLFVVLYYRECETDDVPIPGEPCRSDDQLQAPSRLTDSFHLDLRLEPPKQREEEAVRDFVAWLRQVEISDSITATTPLDQFLGAIRDAAQAWFASSKPSSPPSDFMFGSPPAALQVRPENAGEYLSAAFQLWVTELRPQWYGRWHGCGADTGPPADDCVLLGQINLPVTRNPAAGPWIVRYDVDATVDQQQRPFIMHQRLLQEWLLSGRGSLAGLLPTDPAGVGLRIPVTVLTADATLNASHHCVICNTAANAVTITLPPTSLNSGRVYIIKRVGAFNCTIDCACGDTIDGNASVDLPASLSSITVVADPNSRTWHIVSRV